MSIALYDHQIENIAFGISRVRCGIGDEPGLGKTLSGVSILRNMDAQTILIVCPNVAKGVWRRHLLEHLGDVYVHYYVGTQEKRRKAFFSSFKNHVGRKALVVSFDLAKEAGDLRNHWDYIVVDEAHHIRNHRIKRFKSITKLPFDGAILLTGSPTSKDWKQMYAYLAICNPKIESYWIWIDKWFSTFPSVNGMVIGPPKSIKAFKAMVSEYFIFHKKVDVLKDLPSKIRQAIPVTPTDYQRRIYDEIADEGIADLQDGNYVVVAGTLASIVRSRQVLLSPKLLGVDKPSATLTAMKELVEEQYDAGEPVIMFTPFTEAIPLMLEEIEAFEGPKYVIKGGMSADAIEDVVAKFQSDKGFGVLIVAAQSGSSFTATRASTAIFVGYHWASDINIQCEDRIHRIGQASTVRCLYIVNEETIDEHIIDVVEGKAYWDELLKTPVELFKPTKWFDPNANGVA